MGFSVSASAAIIFVAFLLISITIFGALEETRDVIQSGEETDFKIKLNQKNTRISVESFQYNKTSNNLTMVMSNDSDDVIIQTGYTDFLIDGYPVPRSRTEYRIGESSADIWLPTENIIVNIRDPQLNFSGDVAPRTYESFSKNLQDPSFISAAENIYIVDENSHIDVFSSAGKIIQTINRTEVTAPGDLVVTDYLYVIDSNNHVDRLTKTGSWIDRLINPGQARQPDSIAVTTGRAQDFIFLNSIDDSCIYRYNIDGTVRLEVIDNTEVSSIRDLYVTNIIYVLDYSLTEGYHIDTFDLDGNLITSGLISNLISPTDISVTDSNINSGKIFIIESSNIISVYDLNGNLNMTITDGISDNVFGIDTSAQIYVTDKNNGLTVLNMGCNIKIVTEFGYSKSFQI